MAQTPGWSHGLSILSIALAAACVIVFVFDELRQSQRMWVMALVRLLIRSDVKEKMS